MGEDTDGENVAKRLENDNMTLEYDNPPPGNTNSANDLATGFAGRTQTVCEDLIYAAGEIILKYDAVHRGPYVVYIDAKKKTDIAIGKETDTGSIKKKTTTQRKIRIPRYPLTNSD